MPLCERDTKTEAADEGTTPNLVKRKRTMKKVEKKVMDKVEDEQALELGGQLTRVQKALIQGERRVEQIMMLAGQDVAEKEKEKKQKKKKKPSLKSRVGKTNNAVVGGEWVTLTRASLLEMIANGETPSVWLKRSK